MPARCWIGAMARSRPSIFAAAGRRPSPASGACASGSCWRCRRRMARSGTMTMARKIAHCTVGPRSVAIKAERAPLLITGHQSLEDLRREYEQQGYWLSRHPRHRRARCWRCGSISRRRRRTISRSRSPIDLDLAMDRAERLPPAPACPPLDEARAAVRDVMGWNTIWDGVNHRPYITCSRNWDLKKFGGFGFWLNDTAINALLVSLFDADQARECLATLLSSATPEGNLPCIMTGNDSWVDRTQTPHSFLHGLANISAQQEPKPAGAGLSGAGRQQRLDPPGAGRQRQRHAGVRLLAGRAMASISAPSWRRRTNPSWTTRRSMTRRNGTRPAAPWTARMSG